MPITDMHHLAVMRPSASMTAGLISLMDAYIGKFTNVLQSKSMWDQTLVIFSSVVFTLKL